MTNGRRPGRRSPPAALGSTIDIRRIPFVLARCRAARVRDRSASPRWPDQVAARHIAIANQRLQRLDDPRIALQRHRRGRRKGFARRRPSTHSGWPRTGPAFIITCSSRILPQPVIVPHGREQCLRCPTWQKRGAVRGEAGQVAHRSADNDIVAETHIVAWVLGLLRPTKSLRDLQSLCTSSSSVSFALRCGYMRPRRRDSRHCSPNADRARGQSPSWRRRRWRTARRRRRSRSASRATARQAETQNSRSSGMPPHQGARLGWPAGCCRVIVWRRPNHLAHAQVRQGLRSSTSRKMSPTVIIPTRRASSQQNGHSECSAPARR